LQISLDTGTNSQKLPKINRKYVICVNFDFQKKIFTLQRQKPDFCILVKKTLFKSRENIIIEQVIFVKKRLIIMCCQV
jgi:hypothetical protein